MTAPINNEEVQALQVGVTKTGPPQGGSGPQGIDMNTRASTMKELESKAPEVVEAMKRGIAQQIITHMRRRAERLKKLMREGRRQ